MLEPQELIPKAVALWPSIASCLAQAWLSLLNCSSLLQYTGPKSLRHLTVLFLNLIKFTWLQFFIASYCVILSSTHSLPPHLPFVEWMTGPSPGFDTITLGLFFIVPKWYFFVTAQYSSILFQVSLFYICKYQVGLIGSSSQNVSTQRWFSVIFTVVFEPQAPSLYAGHIL